MRKTEDNSAARGRPASPDSRTKTITVFLHPEVYLALAKLAVGPGKVGNVGRYVGMLAEEHVVSNGVLKAAVMVSRPEGVEPWEKKAGGEKKKRGTSKKGPTAAQLAAREEALASFERRRSFKCSMCGGGGPESSVSGLCAACEKKSRPGEVPVGPPKKCHACSTTFSTPSELQNHIDSAECPGAVDEDELPLCEKCDKRHSPEEWCK